MDYDPERVGRFALATGAMCAILLAAAASRADDREEAKKAFTTGVYLFEQGKYNDAVFSFRKANELNPSWKIYYNIAQCEAALKRYGLALEAFEAYLVEGGDDVDSRRQNEVRKEIVRLRDLSGDLEVKGPEGAVVIVDGVERGVLPLVGPIREAVGFHVVSVFKDGNVLTEQEVKISGVGMTSLNVQEADMQTVPAVEEENPGEERVETEQPVSYNQPPKLEPGNDTVEGEKRSSPLIVWGWAAAGTGVAVAIAGAVTGGIAMKKANTLKDACPGDVCTNPDDYALKDEAQGLATVTNVLLPVGGTIAAAGVVMLIVGWKAGEKESSSVSMVPVVGAGQGGFVIEGRF